MDTVQSFNLLFSWPTRDQSQSPVTWTNLRVLPFQILGDVHDGKLLHPFAEAWTSSISLSVGHHPPPPPPPAVTDEVAPQAALLAPAQVCRHAMTADHACRLCTPGQPPGPRCCLLQSFRVALLITNSLWFPPTVLYSLVVTPVHCSLAVLSI